MACACRAVSRLLSASDAAEALDVEVAEAAGTAEAVCSTNEAPPHGNAGHDGNGEHAPHGGPQMAAVMRMDRRIHLEYLLSGGCA